MAALISQSSFEHAQHPIIMPRVNAVPALTKFHQISATAAHESWVYGYDIETKAQSFRFVTVNEIKGKSKQELLRTYIIGHYNSSVRIIDLVSQVFTGAVGDTIKAIFTKCFKGEKRSPKCIISEGGYFESDKIVIDK